VVPGKGGAAVRSGAWQGLTVGCKLTEVGCVGRKGWGRGSCVVPGKGGASVSSGARAGVTVGCELTGISRLWAPEVVTCCDRADEVVLWCSLGLSQGMNWDPEKCLGLRNGNYSAVGIVSLAGN